MDPRPDIHPVFPQELTPQRVSSAAPERPADLVDVAVVDDRPDAPVTAGEPVVEDGSAEPGTELHDWDSGLPDWDEAYNPEDYRVPALVATKKGGKWAKTKKVASAAGAPFMKAGDIMATGVVAAGNGWDRARNSKVGYGLGVANTKIGEVLKSTTAIAALTLVLCLAHSTAALTTPACPLAQTILVIQKSGTTLTTVL